MRVRVVVEEGEAVTGPPHPLMVGVLLAPVGGLVGTLAAAVLFFLLHGSGAIFTGLLSGGVLIGSIVALPVTALLFPILFYARADRGMFLVFGPFVGLITSSILQAPVLIMSGAVAGFVTALIFTKVARHRPAAATQREG